jgi:hypothetical protein
MRPPLNIEVRDSVFDPNEYGLAPFKFKSPSGETRKVRVRRGESKPVYKVWLYLVGNDVPYVESVTYTLHHTFDEPVRTVRRSLSNPQCQLVIWTWGVFEVRAVVRDKRGGHYELSHHLTYGKQLSMPNVESVYED